MKIITFLLLFLSFNLFSQAPEIEWQKKIGFNNDDEFYSVIRANGSYAIGGMYKNGNDVSQSWLVSISDFGEIFWQKKFNLPKKNLISSVAINNDYTYTIGGYTYERAGFRRDLYYMRLTSTGKNIKKYVIGGKFNDGASNIIALGDGGNLVFGYFSEHENQDLWAIRVNKFGTELWKKTYDITKLDYPVGAIKANDRNFILCANTRTNENLWDVTLIKIGDEKGIEKWRISIGNEFNNSANDFIITQEGDFIFCGVTESKENAKDFWIVKVDTEGKTIWEKTFGWSMNEEANGIYEKVNGNLIVCGYTESKGSGMYDFWVMELDKEGNQLWEKTYGSDANDIAYDITEADDGGIIVVGSTFNGDKKLDGCVLKLKAESGE